MMFDYNKGINTFGYLKKEAEKSRNISKPALKLADKYSMYVKPRRQSAS
jgi:hypothetical protein